MWPTVLLLACTRSSSTSTDTTPVPTDTPTADTHPVVPPARLLLISLDTTRADHLGAWGDRRGLTPALDAFTAGGVQYTQARSAAPWTKPSMSTVMTSTLPSEHGVVQWESMLSEDAVTLVKVLSGAGFATEAYVSHNAFYPPENRFQDGFDTFVPTWLEQPSPGSPRLVETSTYLTDRALEAIGRLTAADEPFFLWVHYVDAHEDYLHHDDPLYLGEDLASIYAEEVGWVDSQLGRLLERAAMDPDLTVAVLADHGEELQDHGFFGHTLTVFDELVHVPLVLRGPTLSPGVIDTPVGTIDLAPTLLELVGVPAPPEFRGTSVLGATQPRVVFHETRRAADVRGVTSWPHKLVVDLAADRTQLFDLSFDPGETNDLSEELPALTSTLKQLLDDQFPEIP